MTEYNSLELIKEDSSDKQTQIHILKVELRRAKGTSTYKIEN